MPRQDFAHVRHWVFDLDNTLYPPQMRLFDQIEPRMKTWIMNTAGVDAETADTLRRRYWQRYGTTLGGLIAEHEIDPMAYLEDVHDISFDALTPDPALAYQIDLLPGRKIVYTNGSAPYARSVLRARGLDGAMDAVYGVEHAGLQSKPNAMAFETVFELDGLNPHHAAMFEDDVRNLAVPYDLGMRTVHVADAPEAKDFVDHHTENLSDFLKQLV
ncbi:MAG: pyrimidine 5'-nucleotidase [Pseudomonadota bacterium]